MKKVLVLGASGAMGRYVVPLLAEKGYAVDAVALDAPDPSADPVGVTRIQGNAKEDAFLLPLLENHYDGIVDFLVYPTAELARKLPLMDSSTGHYIYLSSYRVYDGKKKKFVKPIKQSEATKTHGFFSLIVLLQSIELFFLLFNNKL